MSYKISSYTKCKASKLGVIVKPSTVKGKKIDVYKNGEKVASVGAIGYNDYPTYLELEKLGKVAKGTAKVKQKAYKARHIDRKKVGTPSYFADQLLW
jgi:hypothetical protein